MNPDVVSAIARLRAENILSSGQAALFDRVARRQLVSVRLEIRALLYVGVLLLTSGVGLLVTEHHREIGPWAIAGGIGLAAGACLVWVIRKAAPFSWGEVQSPNVAFDYVLLLGLLLFASDLAYVEVQFTVLGPNWAHHLLVVGAVYLVVASRGLIVLSALATAAVPLAVLAWGARSRRTFLLDTGIVLLALSLVTLRHYVHIAPLWAMLTLSGAALVVLTLAVERALRRAPDGDIVGFTADPLFSDERRQHALQIVPVVAAFTPAGPGPAAQGKDFTGGGGKFGGGGAGEKF